MTAEGIILAGGYSSRAGEYKLTREMLGKPVIERVITAMSAVCCRIVVVTGHEPERLGCLPAKYPTVTLAHNSLYPKGMFSSVLTGCRAITGGKIFITPGDCCAVSQETYLKMGQENKDILVPVYEGKRGHPIVLSKGAISALLSGNFCTLQEFIEGAGYETIEVGDPGILMDIDFPSDFLKMENYLRKKL